MPATVLIIAGSDSIGGAGIQADIKTCCAFGTYAMTAVTAVTAQNTIGVTGIQDITPAMVEKQIEAVAEDIRPDAVKIGMLANSEIVRKVAECLRRHEFRNVVVDPVLVASSGSSLSGAVDETARAMLEELFPLATLITPNIPEAMTLLGIEQDFEDPAEMALRLLALSRSRAVLVKGGHGVKEECRDFLLYHGEDGIGHEEFNAPRIETRNSHGTGCTLSSAIASCLAAGLPLTEAVRKGKEFVTKALENGRMLGLGHGCGPLDFSTPGFNLNEIHR